MVTSYKKIVVDQKQETDMGKWTDLRTKLVRRRIERDLVQRKLDCTISPEKKGRCERRLAELNQEVSDIEAQLAQRQSRVSTPTLAPVLRFADHKSFVVSHGIFPE